MEEAGGNQFEGSLAFAGTPSAIGDINAVPPASDHFRDDLRRILQVCVDDHDSITPGSLQARGHGRLLAEIPGEFEDLNP